MIVERAYQLQAFQLIDAPGWTATARFDIRARAPEGTRFAPPIAGEPPPPQLLMLRTLLAERFKLKAHTEKREATVLALDNGQARASVRSSTLEDCQGM